MIMWSSRRESEPKKGTYRGVLNGNTTYTISLANVYVPTYYCTEYVRIMKRTKRLRKQRQNQTVVEYAQLCLIRNLLSVLSRNYHSTTL
jgi:hypothetical protein